MARSSVAKPQDLCYTLVMNSEPRILDYGNSSYRTDFWEGQGRDYEDLAERIALRRLLPGAGLRLLDIGAGFGRLSEFYSRYEQVVLLDYSESLLREAQARLGGGGRHVYVAASFYAMPFVYDAFDTILMVRVMHHVEDVPALLEQAARILRSDGSYVLEFASKRHLKAILRYTLRQQSWNPFDRSPFEFAEMNFDFHPAWMEERLADAGFHVKHRLTVSHFRLRFLKRFIPPPLLASLDGLCQPTGRWWQLTPSVFLKCGLDRAHIRPPRSHLFRCPSCGGDAFHETPEALSCSNCATRWPIQDGIYNFKEPLPR